MATEHDARRLSSFLAGATTYVLGEVSVMVDHSVPPLPPAHRSRWRYLLPIVWFGLGARLVVAFVRGESVREDFLSLALVAFFMTTAVLGSRIWLWFHDRWDHFFPGRRAQLHSSRAEG
ncbi:MAG: hypothetical protein BGO98_10325 [Myxococcales bacterium 68-20]|nr:MAG: hypothetical protein BGO98_10325 [Myxococcales bacterium 68-20]